MKTLDRAVISEWFQGFSISLLLLVLTLFLIQGSRISSLLFSLGPDVASFLKALLSLLPSYLVLCIPMAHMFACLTLALRYRRDGEANAMQTLGLGASRLLKPLLFAAFLAGFVSTVISFVVEPQSKEAANRLVLQMASTAAQSRIVEGEIIQLTPQISFYAARRNDNEFENAFMAYGHEKNGQRMLWAKRADIEKRDNAVILKLKDGGLLEPDQQALSASFANLEMRLPLLSEDGGAVIFPVIQCASSAVLIAAGNRPENAFELGRRMTAPVAGFFAGTAALLAAFLLPHSLPYLSWILSLLLLASYYLSGRLGEILAFTQDMPPLLASLTPLFPMIAATLALAFIRLRKAVP